MNALHAPEPQNPVLVLGGTGKTGRRVVARLRRRGVPVRVGSRSGMPPFDWNDPATWEPALRGAGAAYVSYSPDLAVPGAARAIAAFCELAVARGTRRLVLVSGRGFLAPLLAGELALPADRVPEPFVDADDIADVVVASLTDARHAGELYELTGPRLLRFDEAVAEIARASGRRIGYRSISNDEFTAGLAADGVPDDVIAPLDYLFATVLDGRNARVADGVQRALGRPPRDFGDYARDAAATGVWDVARAAA